MNKHFQALKDLSKNAHLYQSILSLLHWDYETYMPKGSASSRTEQIAILSEHIHNLKTSKTFKTHLEKLISLSTGKIKVKGLKKEQQICLREWRKTFLRNTLLPTKFVKKFAELTAKASQVWAVSRKENNFSLFAPYLEEIIQMNREKAKIFGFEDHPYNALIESFEPCMSVKRLDTLFGSLQKNLTSLLKKIEKGKKTENRFLSRKVDDKTQKIIGDELLKDLPIDPDFSRLDLSTHPFSIAMHPHDSRITTRILPHAFISNIFSILHEVGHSLYEMNLPSEHFGDPLCEAVSLSVHESQSRFWETVIGRNLPFWKSYYPKLKKKIPSILKDVSLSTFYKAINQVKPSLIRVEADEVTYCLHVILRYEMEKKLIDGSLSVSDLPKAWKEKSKELLGVSSKTDREGCLQDIHWSLGEFGYFPTYALGNLLALQLFSAFKNKHKDYEEKIASGDLTFVKDFLKENVHQYGKTYNLDQLVKKTTKKAFSEKDYCQYLEKKYKEIYRL